MVFTGPNAIPEKQPEKPPLTMHDLAEMYVKDQEAVAALSFSSGDVVAEVKQARASRHLATQTLYPWRTAIRSGVATLLLFLVAAAAASPIIGPFVDRYIPGAGAGVLGFGVFCGALALLLKRIGSIPAVARLFVRLGLGVVPKAALK